MSPPVRLFYACAPEDDELCAELGRHLIPLARGCIVDPWHPGRLLAGAARDQESRQRLAEAEIILLPLSVDLLAWDACPLHLDELLTRHAAGTARVLVVLLRAVDRRWLPTSELPILPRGGRPIREWPDRDAAWTEVAAGIGEVASALRHGVQPRSAPRSAAPAGSLITLSVFLGRGLVRRESFTPARIRIGRLRSADLVIDDDSVSRMHAVIDVSPTGHVSLFDLGSATGTFVNGHRVGEAALAPGDEITVGPARIRLDREQPAPRSAGEE